MKPNELSFVFRAEDCIQCHGCETACKTWRSVELGVMLRRVFNIWRGAYPDVQCASLSLACQHCLEPACVAVCPVGAITKRPDGVVAVDAERCIGCRACLEACPFNVPQFGADGKMLKCDMCRPEGPDAAPGFEIPPCVRTCPTHALGLRTMTAPEKAEAEAAAKALCDEALKGAF